MSFVFQIPKTSQYIQTSNTFSAAFNVPTLGLYDFNVAGNQNQTVIPLNPNSIYLLNKVTIGGTIPQETYLFNIVTLPLITLNYKKEKQRIYQKPIPVVQFVDGLEAIAWLWTDQSDDDLEMSIKPGQLSQDAFLVGVTPIKINVSLSLFEISDNGFVQDFKNPNNLTGIGKKTNLHADSFVFVK